MSKPAKIDAPDTIDTVFRVLAGLQADGWGLVEVNHRVEYGKAVAKGRSVPVGATVTVKLRPAK